MNRMKRGSCIIAALLLGGCALFGDTTPSTLQPEPLPTIAHPVTVQTLWDQSVGEGSDGQYANLMPATFGDRIYVSDIQGNVRALDRTTGQLLWETPLETQIVAGLSASNGRVIVGTRNGHLLALDAQTGKSLWNVALDGAILAAPQTDGNTIVVLTHNQETHGVDAATGKSIWLQTNTQPVLTLEGDSTPLITDGVVFVGYANGHVRAMMVNTGQILWDRSIAMASGRSELERMVDINAQPLLDNDLLYAVSYQGSLAAIDIRSSELRWLYKVSSYRNIAEDYGNIYVTQSNGIVHGVDSASGKKAWIQTRLQYRNLSAPVTLGDYVILSDDQGYLYLLSQEDGVLVGYQRLDASAGAMRLQVVDDETLYAYTSDGTLYALHLKSDDAS